MARKIKRTTSFKFQPFSLKQKKLLMWWTDKSLYKDHDMLIAHGAIRSGKTISMIDSFVTWSLAKHRNQNFIIAGKSMGALKRNVLEPMFQILTAKGIDYHYHRSENPHVIIGSNTYYLFGANNESSQDVLQGLTAAGAYLDEVALFPRSFVDQAIGRCSADTKLNGVVHGAKIFFNCNPAGPYHWFKTDYIDKAKEKRILVLHFTMDDNLSLSEKVKERFRRMFSGVFFRRYILGLWVMAEGVIFSMFNEEKHKKPRSWFPIKFDRKFICIDFGIENPTAFLKYGVIGDTYYELDEYFHDGRNQGQKTVGQYSKELRAFMDGDEYAIFIDPSAKALIIQLKEDGVKNIKGAVNDVLDGIQTVSNKFGNDEIYICEDNRNSIKELFSYVWDEKAAERGEDRPVKQNDHTCDARRYGIHTDYLIHRIKIKRNEKKNKRKEVRSKRG